MPRTIPPTDAVPEAPGQRIDCLPKHRGRAGRRGAIALEYVLITALVAIALLGAFKLWGHNVYYLFSNVAWDSGAALKEIVQ